MLDPFDQKKQSIVAEIELTLSATPDASPKGSIDEHCIPIIRLINSHQHMVTTLSCSGRVSVFLEGIKNVSDTDDVQIGAKGNSGWWIFVTHEPSKLQNWYKDIDFSYEQEPQVGSSTRYILFKFEPLILHVKCRDLAQAQALYIAAMDCGFRESGIGTNNIVGIRISIKLDVPIGYCKDDGTLVLLVSEEYLNLITKLSEDRFKENFRKLDVLYQAIEKLFVREEPEKVETKEERRERKIKEGMERREAVRMEKDRKKREKEEKERKEAEK